MKFRALLKKIDLALRTPHVKGQGGGDKAIDAGLDALATAGTAEKIVGYGDPVAPTNWVPSQQDDRPRH